MNKSDFIKHTAEHNSISKTEAEKVVNMFVDSTIQAIGKGENISLVGFGNFSIKDVAARAGRNPQTGAAIEIPAYKAVTFKAGQTLKDACNK